ncbi:DNA repair protein [Nitrosopumilus sp.]|uniref:DNA repair protein n=1 Tax=Nitrosopumilus sp. TaxID=2024843 RepID=UPI00247D696D|nr:DNA repair protein [Nitrosopumilus sp.]MCV0431398.1 DNA repair protein [Nitrosopumilus sp.]
MGLFGKKKTEEIQDYSEEKTLKAELELEVEKLQNDFREKQEALDKINEKTATVKEEYDSTVGNLMLVKKELNQKMMELDIIKREYKEIQERNKKSELIKDTESIDKFKKTQGEHAKIKEELEEFAKKYEEIKEQISQEQTILHNIKKQQVEVEEELEEANSRLYNAKQELDKKDTFEDTSVLSQSEKEFIGVNEENKKTSAGIIEAASAVVGSLKSKLNTTQKELDAIQTLLQNERDDHEKTKQELEKLKQSTNFSEES